MPVDVAEEEQVEDTQDSADSPPFEPEDGSVVEMSQTRPVAAIIIFAYSGFLTISNIGNFAFLFTLDVWDPAARSGVAVTFFVLEWAFALGGVLVGLALLRGSRYARSAAVIAYTIFAALAIVNLELGSNCTLIHDLTRTDCGVAGGWFVVWYVLAVVAPPLSVVGAVMVPRRASVELRPQSALPSTRREKIEGGFTTAGFVFTFAFSGFVIGFALQSLASAFDYSYFGSGFIAFFVVALAFGIYGIGLGASVMRAWGFRTDLTIFTYALFSSIAIADLLMGEGGCPFVFTIIGSSCGEGAELTTALVAFVGMIIVPPTAIFVTLLVPRLWRAWRPLAPESASTDGSALALERMRRATDWLTVGLGAALVVAIVALYAAMAPRLFGQ